MDEKELLRLLTQPSDRLVMDIQEIEGDILILGCGGKIGPSLAIMAKRAFDLAGINKRVIGASQFDYPGVAKQMRDAGVEVIEADLFDPEQLAALPDVKNIIYMVGRKFGTHKDPYLTWAINVLLPTKVCERFPDASIVAFSTGNVYRYMDISSGGSTEEDVPEPVGEYGQTSLGRERMFEYYAGINKNKVLLLRLNYAIDLRYGVLFDIAKDIQSNAPINVGIGYFNCIWQGDVCEYALRSLLHVNNPPCILNVTGPESISIRWAATKMGELLGKTPVFTDEPDRQKSLFSNTTKLTEMMGYPHMPLLSMMRMVADWVKSGGSTIDAPTHFEQTDGKF
ncbi:MAG: NAD(P)-dependent oxidoreductase [Chloroflexota bacterium]|jgi:dTDP-4-dehydrorhamnose reductase|nr:NAD(P)-dependent oxidoreductase [Chloroflexota bacterium]